MAKTATEAKKQKGDDVLEPLAVPPRLVDATKIFEAAHTVRGAEARVASKIVRLRSMCGSERRWERGCRERWCMGGTSSLRGRRIAWSVLCHFIRVSFSVRVCSRINVRWFLCLADLFGSFLSWRIFVVGDVRVARSVVVGPTRPVAEGRMRRSVDCMQLLSQDIHWIIGMWIRCVSVRSTELVNEMEGGVVQGRTLVFWGCGVFENSAGMFATILMALRCEVRLTTSFIAQHHREHGKTKPGVA